ncbi:MarR family winged helix-turn-helix transcriptional regulator [Nonomuraea sp. NPDC050556]|uniref:MarR family winged helix-turn-helix transcriptional regulator n=1 Tax=Nonomuraea sp. NPDC050556 TaxID=3364369 RepID=UPI0037965837
MSREKIEEVVSNEMQLMQAAVNDYDEAVARALGINRTDLRCLEILTGRESATPSVLGPALGLTTGSVTAMLDRLEKLGYLTRSPDPDDRRKVVVRITEEVREDTWGFYKAFAEEGAALMGGLSEAELELVGRFLRGAREMYDRQLDHVRTLPAVRTRKARK